MYLSFSGPSYVKVIKFIQHGERVEKKVDVITLLPQDKLELSCNVVGLQIIEPNLPGRVVDMKPKPVKEPEPDLLTLYHQLEDKCSILGITPEDYIKQNKPSLF